MRTESPGWRSAVHINARSCFSSTAACLNIYSAAPVDRSNLQSQELSEEEGGAYFPPSVLHPLSIKVEENRVHSKGSRGNYPPSPADSSYLLFLLLLCPPPLPLPLPSFLNALSQCRWLLTRPWRSPHSAGVIEQEGWSYFLRPIWHPPANEANPNDDNNNKKGKKRCSQEVLDGSQSGGSSLPLRENKVDAGSESKDTCGKADVKTKNMADMCQAKKNTMETLSSCL